MRANERNLVKDLIDYDNNNIHSNGQIVTRA